MPYEEVKPSATPLLLFTAWWDERWDCADIIAKITCTEKHQKHTPQKTGIAAFLAFSSLNMEMLKAV